MKIMHMRIDQKIAEIIEKNAGQQGIKPTRYVRSLIEKGLVIDHQIQAGIILDSNIKHGAEFMPKVLEIVLENLMLTRKLIRQSVASAEEHQEILEFAHNGAKEYVAKQLV